jgi:hypothetical protein
MADNKPTTQTPQGEIAAWEKAHQRMWARALLTYMDAIDTAMAAYPSRVLMAALRGDERQQLREGLDAIDRFKADLDAPSNVVPFPDRQS